MNGPYEIPQAMEEMRIDATSLFETYREAARHLRNTFFSTRDSGDWDVVEDFEAVDRVLFQTLVLRKLSAACDKMTVDPAGQDMFLIEPCSGGMPAMISRDAPASGYWDHPIKSLSQGDAVLAFQKYFDWDQHGMIDYRYLRATILRSARYPEIEGHEALIETIYARIVFHG